MQTVQISPNTTLFANRLSVNDRHQDLRHGADFKAFVFATSSRVAAVIAELFPNIGYVPGEKGTVEPSTEEPWVHYNRHALKLQMTDVDSPEFQQLGTVVLQWCAVALVFANATKCEIQNSPDFKVLQYLARKGGAALGCSLPKWNEHLEYLAWRATGAGLLSDLNGPGHKDPLPPGVVVSIPWPEKLGAHMGDPKYRFDQVCLISPDIVCVAGQTILHDDGYVIYFDFENPLVSEFEKLAEGKTEKNLTLQLNYRSVASDYVFRAQRYTIEPGRSEYVFRQLAIHAEMLQ